MHVWGYDGLFTIIMGLENERRDCAGERLNPAHPIPGPTTSRTRITPHPLAPPPRNTLTSIYIYIHTHAHTCNLYMCIICHRCSIYLLPIRVVKSVYKTRQVMFGQYYFFFFYFIFGGAWELVNDRHSHGVLTTSFHRHRPDVVHNITCPYTVFPMYASHPRAPYRYIASAKPPLHIQNDAS